MSTLCTASKNAPFGEKWKASEPAENSTEKDTQELDYERNIRLPFDGGRQSYGRHGGLDIFWRRFMKENIRLQLFPAFMMAKLITDDSLEIIGGNNVTVITMKTFPITVPGEFIAVLDNAQSNRVFLGHIVQGKVHGGIVYFCPKGIQHKHIKVFPDSLFAYILKYRKPKTWEKYSNRIPDKANMAFHNDCLIYLHYSQGDVTMHVVRLKHDQLLSVHELHSESWSSTILHCYDRWLSHLNKDTDKIISFDLTSFRCSASETDKDVFYDAGTFPVTGVETLVEKLSSLSTPNYEPTERDGYPIKCIKCNAVTSIGYYIDQTSEIYLGRSFCATCMINFEFYRKQWECAKPSAEEDRDKCDSIIEEGKYYCCDKDHLCESEYQVQYMTTLEDVALYNEQAEVHVKVNFE
jgi:hypothetical protein